MLAKYFYITTEDRKLRSHQYKLPVSEAAPDGHEITDLRPAGLFPITDFLSVETIATLRQFAKGLRNAKT